MTRGRQEQVLTEDEAQAEGFKRAAEFEGIHVEYGDSYPYSSDDGHRYFGLVLREEVYLKLAEEENAHYRTIHEADERFADRPPSPREAYEPSDELSREAMQRQSTYVGDQPSRMEAITASRQLFAEQT